ncbi:MAG: hypothetical protein QG622_2640 [Actinomycetota bacterium]|nr:hypothetical protein [Actinomycetota bacterium]
MVASLTLHVSLPCSGASQLQGILSRGRAALREQGIWYPGEGCLPRDGLNQQAIGDARDQAVRHAETTRAEIAGHPGHVIVSADSLAHLDATGVEEVLALLGARPDTVRVVITALDLGRLLPALWTNTVENGFTTHFEPYLMAAVDRRRDDGEPWRTALDLPALVSRWQAAVGADRVTLVPVPPETTGPGLLWTRFAEAAGLEPRPPAPLPFGRATDDGTRLSAGQAQMLRALNSVMLGLPSPTQRELRERVLAAWGASGASGTSGESSGPRLVLPDSFRGTVREWAAEDITRLRAIHARLCGRITDLDPVFGPSTGPVAEPVRDTLARDVLALLTPVGGEAATLDARVPRARARPAEQASRSRW